MSHSTTGPSNEPQQGFGNDNSQNISLTLTPSNSTLGSSSGDSNLSNSPPPSTLPYAQLPRRHTHLSPFDLPNIQQNPRAENYFNDSRSSSTASLVPSIAGSECGKRTLLLVFIHGFIGNEQSFRGFPAYIHQVLTVMVQDTHVVHTKIYPKFKTRHALNLAVNDFSKWLKQFESPTTDTVLLGHSMGGLLAADIVLLGGVSAPRHRILGTVNFDVPFAGINKRVVTAGLSSIFRPPPKAPQEASPEDVASFNDSASTYSSVSGATSEFEQPAPEPKKSTFASAFNFINKHQADLFGASVKYVTSHFEFTGSLLDVAEMRTRYEKIRALERPDIEDRRRCLGAPPGQYTPRVRFVNYYTTCFGRSKAEEAAAEGTSEGISEGPSEETDELPSYESIGGTGNNSQFEEDKKEKSESNLLEPSPNSKDNDRPPSPSQEHLPPRPMPPPAFLPSPDMSPQAYKIAEKTYNKELKNYHKALKAYQKQVAKATPKPRTFCNIPSENDNTWVDVRMHGMDEVGAHSGLFFIRGTDESFREDLVGEVSCRIETWAKEYADEIMMREMAADLNVSGEQQQMY